MRLLITRAIREESGQDLIEYAMLTAFISIIAVTLIKNIGLRVDSWYEGYGAQIRTIPGANGGS